MEGYGTFGSIWKWFVNRGSWINTERIGIPSKLTDKGPKVIIDLFFKSYIDYLDIDAMKQSSDVIYIVDAKMVLRAYNHAWINFAKNNDGRIILAKYSTGSRIVDSTSGPLRSFIISAYKKALYENKPFEHNFECSSANQYRLFRQTAYPLIDSKGLVISNHLVEECPHPEQAQVFRQQFINGQGFVTQCANCRKIRDPKNYHSWLWVPSLVENPFPNTSHGICPQCYDHYYPEIDDDKADAIR